MACKNGIKSNPMSFAPTQMEPATWGSQVKGLLTKTVAISTGRFSRKNTPSRAQITICTGSSGVGGIKAMNKPKANARVTLDRLKVKHPRSGNRTAKCFKHQCFSSVSRFGVKRFSQRRMRLFTPPLAALCRFRRPRMQLIDRLVNQWLEAGAESAV